MREPEEQPRDLPAELEELVMEILDEPDDVRGVRLEQLYRDHPEHAGRIRQRLGTAEELASHIDAAFPGIDADGGRVGRYRILDLLGEGGMGTVYLAEQHEPVRRQVALKVIKLGMDTKQVLARFEAERQALALMDHPGIATVLDAGVTPAGRPFFAMEYVPGVAITKYCDEQQLTVRERLELLLAVCAAVQHAHQKGIVHRDLKPSNVLVRQEQGEASPRIIDFGLARATDLQLTERTLCTLDGAVVGTPEYMSPEQAELSGDVDTRTDIYSLGAVLYELLAGVLPLGSGALRAEGLDEMRRRIREEDPPRPSTRISAAAPSSTEVTRRRRTDVPGLVRALGGDLDWITMKALEKDPDRRYQTAGELAADIERHLRDEPILARPPSRLYRLGKLYRRNKVTVIAGASVVLALLAGLVVSTSLLLEVQAAHKAETAARTTADTHRDALVMKALLTEADGIRPTWPEDVGPADRWLEQATTVFGRAQAYRAALAGLEARATRVDQEDVAPSRRAAEQQLKELERVRDVFEAYRLELRPIAEPNHKAHYLAEILKDLPAAIERTRQRAVGGSRWRYAHPSDEGLHRALVELVDGLPVLQQRIREMRQRRDRASRMDRVCFEQHEAAWAAAIAAIADSGASPIYEGLQLKRQRGLYPIGKDPRSGLFEFAHAPSGEPPARDPETGRLKIDAETGMVFVLIPAGVVEAGIDRIRGASIETFLLSKYEMTQGQWQRLTGTNPSYYRAGLTVAGVSVDARHPVERVSWHDCVEVLTRLGLTLPSEAQWAYAARAGTAGRWLTGDEEESLRRAANLRDLSFAAQWGKGRHFPWDDGYAIHAPVGRFRPNRFGLHDVSGNVTEWCLERVPDRNQPDWTAPAEMRRNRVQSYSFQMAPPRAMTDGRWYPIMRDLGIGVRPARALELAR